MRMCIVTDTHPKPVIIKDKKTIPTIIGFDQPQFTPQHWGKDPASPGQLPAQNQGSVGKEKEGSRTDVK